ncbi:GntR family transcriptional regulator [Streptomyces stelliscabiei]|uniref:DNA-binding GntR family transcriptional regulator n=1 Tax=Streptomyces stelliscabiei TaxID=146820 RepID=A0A8I0PFA9_9ACTN|nr:GntR family transcriptional regulator [Streptomyces stelliscabiei]KND42968.1 GntR family transcriptional regulator [Streptomyces stelliscabiei]MBE1602499.1 DNA-binding GntR family transcriptional regulator [Streptomyces stelliscabiei]MDX2516719.1 GntR family transcriptional regulator [Streptomyces stelliscabiei]
MTAPLYVRIRREIEAGIRAGELPPGARLPTEKDLSTRYGVSRATAQRVLNDLAEAGLAIRRRRHGTFVADVTRQINLLNFVTPATAAKGTPGRHDVVSARVVRAADAVLRLPGAAADTAVVELVRRKLDVHEKPQSVERHVVLFAAAPDLLSENLEHLVTLPYLRRGGVPVDTIRLYLDPVTLDEHDAALLDSEIGTPALMRRRELRTDDGSTVEVVTTLVRPGTAEFFLELPVPAM